MTVAAKRRFFRSAADFRAWLAKQHASARELWVGFHRIASGKPSITHSEALDEALCVGWIDGLARTVDDTSYMIRFSPRRPRSKWSAVNLRKIDALRKAGRVTPAGLAALNDRDRAASGYSVESGPRALDAASEKRFRADREAWAFYQSQPPGYRRLTANWVMSAKREETRRRRLDTLITESARSRRIPPLNSPKKGTKG